MIADIIIIALLLVLGAIAIRALQRPAAAAEGVSSELARLRVREQDYQQASDELRRKAEQVEALRAANAGLETELRNERQRSAERQQTLEESETRLKTQFENLATRILEDRGKALNEQSREKMAALLQPFKEQLEAFRQRVDQVHREDTEQSAKLLQKVIDLQTLSNRVSEEANNLTKAIKGDAKTQGNWGELIVERIFEASGLIKGQTYDSQRSMTGAEGRAQRPDFVVYLPGGKAIIVDSKVSLTAYERACAVEPGPGRDAAMREHLDSVKNHVKGLDAKQYGALLGNRTLDFVIMCIPIEPAYQAALQAEPALMYDLAKTNVVVSGPTTLMITLKLIAQIWRRENENRNAEKIAERAGRLYEQVRLVTESVTDIQKSLKSATGSVEEAMRRLSEGKGNLAGRVEELRELGAKVSKQLPADVLSRAREGADPGSREASNVP